jgi:hypothetical protein
VLEFPSARQTAVARIVTFDGDLEEAIAPMSVTVTLEDEIDVSRGSLLASPASPPHFGRHFEAHTVWMTTEPLERSRAYLLRHGPHEVQARAVAVRHAVEIETLEPREASSLGWNEIGLVLWETSQPLAYDLYPQVRGNGAFILIDPLSNRTIAAGMIEAAAPDPYGRQRRLRPAQFHAGPLTPAERATRSGHTGALILSDPSSPAAQLLERRLFERGAEVLLLDTPVQPLEPLLRAGLIVITGRAAVCRDYPALSMPEAGSSVDPERAAEEMIEQLREKAILLDRDQFSSGEGI